LVAFVWKFGDGGVGGWRVHGGADEEEREEKGEEGDAGG